MGEVGFSGQRRWWRSLVVAAACIVGGSGVLGLATATAAYAWTRPAPPPVCILRAPPARVSNGRIDTGAPVAPPPVEAPQPPQFDR